MPEPLLTVEEAATYLRLARQTIYNMVYRRAIPFLKAGKELRFRRSDLEAWMEANAAGHQPRGAA